MLLLLTFLLTNQGWAKGACPDSSARELARVSAAPGIVLLACGSRMGVVPDLSIYRLSGKERDRLLDGDAAMKAYRVRRSGRGFDVEEGLASPFRPFVQMRVACEGSQCAARDAKCLWKKESASNTGKTWTDKFLQALNGDAGARAPFEGQGLSDPMAAEHSEAFSTHRADLLRLKALGCLR
jgi:hypothetical protein